MTTSPEPLIDLASGSESEDGSINEIKRRPPPPPPPVSSKPKPLVRSNTTITTTKKPIIPPRKTLSSPKTSPVVVKPSPPPKPTKKVQRTLSTPPGALLPQMVPSTDPESHSPVYAKVIKPKPLPKPGVIPLAPPSESTRITESPAPDELEELMVVRQTPTSERDDTELHINGEGLLIDLTALPDSDLPFDNNLMCPNSTDKGVDFSHSSSEFSSQHRKGPSKLNRSNNLSQCNQPICLPKLSSRELEYEEKEHPRSVFKQLNILREKSELCDVILTVDDKEIKAHKVVMAANSPYFEDMFVGEFAEPDGVPIVIEEVDEDSLLALVQFAYTSRIKLTQNNVYRLFEAADVLQFHGVKNACFRFFKSQMNKTNCIRTWLFADSHNCTELLEASLKFIEVNFLDIIRGNEFLSIEVDTVCRIIALEDIAITCEEQVYDAVLGWINHNPTQRKSKAIEVFQYVRFPSMNREYLLHIVDNEPIIRDDPDCLQMLITALESHVSSVRGTLKKKLQKQGTKYLPRAASMAVEVVDLVKGEASLGVGIMGGSDRPTHVFRQGDKPGIFIREVIPGGMAANSGKLRTGDRILSINGTDVSSCPHDKAIRMLVTGKESLTLLVRHEPPPAGLKEVTLVTKPGGGFGFSIAGGVNGEPVNSLDETDEGIFIVQIIPGGAAEQDGRLCVGTRILQVNSISLLGKTHDEALKILHGVLDRMTLLVCHGYNPLTSTPVNSESGSITSWGDGIIDEQTMN